MTLNSEISDILHYFYNVNYGRTVLLAIADLLVSTRVF